MRILLPVAILLAAAGCRGSAERYAPISPAVREIAGLAAVDTARSSSWERTGGNRDCTPIDAGATRVLAEIPGAGAVRLVYIGTTSPGPVLLRELVLRMYWDGETSPSVEVPLGDFFLTAHEAYVRHFASSLVVINPGTLGGGSHGYHAYFAMPFSNGARITVENQGARRSHQLCYQIAYETYRDPLPPDIGRFHAQWRRDKSTAPEVPEDARNKVQWEGKNTDGKNNYVILDAAGRGRVVGLHLSVENDHPGWYGEGDDMIFIDGEAWPPRYHGTGTEEIFGGGATPDHEYTGPHTGFHLVENRGGTRFAGKVSMYRWYIHDPIRFARSIRWTLEHGHANNFDNEYTSVAYWYQEEPHKAFPALPPAAERHSRMPEEYGRARERLLGLSERLGGLSELPAAERERLREIRRQAHRAFQENRFDETLALLERHDREAQRLAPAKPTRPR